MVCLPAERKLRLIQGREACRLLLLCTAGWLVNRHWPLFPVRRESAAASLTAGNNWWEKTKEFNLWWNYCPGVFPTERLWRSSGFVISPPQTKKQKQKQMHFTIGIKTCLCFQTKYSGLVSPSSVSFTCLQTAEVFYFLQFFSMLPICWSMHVVILSLWDHLADSRLWCSFLIHFWTYKYNSMSKLYA